MPTAVVLSNVVSVGDGRELKLWYNRRGQGWWILARWGKKMDIGMGRGSRKRVLKAKEKLRNRKEAKIYNEYQIKK